MEQYAMAMCMSWLLILLYTLAAMCDPALTVYKSPKAWILVVVSAGFALWGASVL